MGLFRRRPPRQEYAVSVEALWGALKAALPSVTSQATFYEESLRVEWTMDRSAFDWPERMSARVEASRDGGAAVTVEGKSAYGAGAKSVAGPGRRSRPRSARSAGRPPGRPLTTTATATGTAVTGPASLLRPHHPVRRAGLHSPAHHADPKIDLSTWPPISQRHHQNRPPLYGNADWPGWPLAARQYDR
jgi:hypothetical protein